MAEEEGREFKAGRSGGRSNYLNHAWNQDWKCRPGAGWGARFGRPARGGVAGQRTQLAGAGASVAAAAGERVGSADCKERKARAQSTPARQTEGGAQQLGDQRGPEALSAT